MALAHFRILNNELTNKYPDVVLIGTFHYIVNRGSIPAKVGFWVGLRIFSCVPTPTKLTNAISKTQLLGPNEVHRG